ncbi:MAG: acetyl-CoA C-acyltransferase [Vulcanimicrobiota bacterium]
MHNGKTPVIVSAVRTPVGRGRKGSLAATRPDDLAALVMNAALAKARVAPEMVEDVVFGCAMPEGEQGLNVARLAALLAGLPVEVPAVTVNRFCSSGLQAVAMAAQSIATGMTDCAIAGGVESMSMVPMTGYHPSMNLRLFELNPGAYLGMGLTAENLASKYSISRQEQDEFALASHQRAAAAIEAGKFKDEIVPVEVRFDQRKGAKVESKMITFDTDELVRSDTSMEALGSLKPSFKLKGSVTPGNSSPISDGAAALVLMSADKAKAEGLEPLAEFVSFAVAGVPPEIMGIGPVAAIPKALAKAGLKLDDIKVIELNEAFAAQSLAVLKEMNIPLDRVNENGGAIALGHPLGCTGAKLSATTIHELRRRGGGYGMVTMCIGGGQGAAGIFKVN